MAKFIEIEAVNGYLVSVNVEFIVQVINRSDATAIKTINEDAGVLTNLSYEEVLKLINDDESGNAPLSRPKYLM